MTARKKPLTIHDFPEVDLGDNHFIHAKNLFVKHNTDNFYRVYILHIRKYCYDENKNPRCVLIDVDSINKILDTNFSINIQKTKTTTKDILVHASISLNGSTATLPYILFEKPPENKVFIYINSTLDVRKKNIVIGAHRDILGRVHDILKSNRITSNISKGKNYLKDIITVKFKYNCKVYSKSFTIDKFGGEENARKLANKWMDETKSRLEAEFPLITPT